MGGFWLRAAVALENAGLNACGWALGVCNGCRSAREKAKPTGWQDWQAEQASQSALAAALTSLAPGLALSAIVP